MTFYLGSAAYLGSDAYLGINENAQFNGSGTASATAAIAGDKWVARSAGILARGTTTQTIPLPRTPAPGALLVAVVSSSAIISSWSNGWYLAKSILNSIDMKMLVKDYADGTESNLVLTLNAANCLVAYEVFEFAPGAVLTNQNTTVSGGFPALSHVDNADFFYQTAHYAFTGTSVSGTWSAGTELADMFVTPSGTDGIYFTSNYQKDVNVSGGTWTPPTLSTSGGGVPTPQNMYFAVATGGNVPTPKWVKRTHGTLLANGTTSHTIPTPSGSSTPAGSFLMLVISASVTNTISASGWTERQQVVNSIELSLFTKDSAAAGEASVTVAHNAADYGIAYEFFEFAPGTAFVNSASGTTTWPTLSGVGTSDFLYQATGSETTFTDGMGSEYGVTFGSSVKKSSELVAVQKNIGGNKAGAFLASAWRDDSGLSSWTPTSTTTTGVSLGQTNYKVAVGLNVVEPATGNSRTANFNGTGTASAVVEKIGGDSGGSTPEHSVFGTNVPGTLTTANDGQGITIGTAFYMASGGPSAWRVKGAKLYVPAGSALIGQTVTFKMWAPGIEYNGGTFASPTQSKVSATLVQGWNQVYFDTPANMGTSATQKIVIGYTSTGNYMYVSGGANTAIQAADGSQFYLSEASASSLAPARRGWYRYANNSGGVFDFISGIDVIVDEGAPTVPTRNAQFNGSGTASAAVYPVEIRTAQFNGSGTASAGVVKVEGGVYSVTATFNGSGTASAPVVKVEVRTAQFNGTGTASAVAGAVRTIAQENALTGESSEWVTISGAGDPTNLGFAREFSVNAGETINFSCHGSGTVLDIYRIGYYGGLGWRKITTLVNTATTQPAPATIPNSNGANTCIGWSTTASWAIPSTTVSGLYVGVYRNAAQNNASYIPFVVRQDAVDADIVIKTSDATWALAYNYFDTMASPFTGKSVYGSGGAVGGTGGIQNRAHATTYHKPIVTRDGISQTYWTNAEAPLIRWIERMGYNVKYVSSKDVDQIGASVVGNAKIVISSGHDEYWSQPMKDAFYAMRDAGKHLLFMSGNQNFWRTRYTDSGDLMWCYKDTMAGPGGHVAGTALDPVSWTGSWKDTRPANAATRDPEGVLTGTDFRMNGVLDLNATFNTGVYNLHPVWRNSSYAGGSAFTANRIVGFEADAVDPRTAGYARLAGQVFNINGSYADDNGENYSGNGNLDWGIVAQAYSSGARVIGFGTCQWQWALDGTHDRGNTTPVLDIQQFQYNLLRDLGAAPVTPHSGIVTSSPMSLANYGIADVATRTAQFSSEGTASATSMAVLFRTATFNGFGTASAVSQMVGKATAQFSSEGTASAAISVTHTLTASYSGEGTVSATITAVGGTYDVSAQFSGEGTASATVQGSAPVTASFTGSGQASATVAEVEFANAQFGGEGTASASAGTGYQVTATFNGSGSVSATSSSVHTVQAQYSGSGQAGAIGFEIEIVNASFSGQGQLSAYVPGASGSILTVGVWNGSVLQPAAMTVWNGTAEVPVITIGTA